ncbi:hypothetical protein [Nocardia fusca]|uniref:hypothetical protein n=1 Tax=Nocardia fusca TaxID=941183 RepID=UPI0012F4E45E|nr:hypothetical protein [Nocardia fusca]
MSARSSAAPSTIQRQGLVEKPGAWSLCKGRRQNGIEIVDLVLDRDAATSAGAMPTP